MVEDAAHHDGIVRRVVVPEAIARVVAAPGHLRAGQEAMEEPLVKIFKQSFQVVGTARAGTETLPSAHLAHQVGLPADMMAGNVRAITGRGLAVNGRRYILASKMWAMAFNTGAGAPSSRSERRTSSLPSRMRMVFLMLVKGKNSTVSPGKAAAGEGRGTTVQRFGERCASRPARLAAYRALGALQLQRFAGFLRLASSCSVNS